MIQDLSNIVSFFNIAIEHTANQIDTVFAGDERDTQVTVHNLVDAVEGIFFVDDGV